MTDDTRETLTKLAEKFEFDHPYGTALRDVLTPRTCGTCRHYHGGQCDNENQPHYNISYIGPDDGCIRGWQAREGEGGGK